MGISDVAGVFSRYFVVGFFLPAFFTLIALVHTVNAGFLPDLYNESSKGAQIAIVGGAALLIGLLLLGLIYPIRRLYEGYPLRARGTKWPLKTTYALLFARQKGRYERLKERSQDESVDEARRFDARWRLDRQFPRDEPGLVLPTAFGNATRAAERHSFTRWHLNNIAIWPHVESLLSTQEVQVLSDARGDVAFFLNFSLLVLVSAPIVIADRLVHDGHLSALLGLVPLVLSVLMYKCATGAAERLGEVIRAGIDLHRREIYTKLGIRTPKNFTDERTIAWNLNNTLLIGEHLPDQLSNGPVVAVQHQGGVEVRPKRAPRRKKETDPNDPSGS